MVPAAVKSFSNVNYVVAIKRRTLYLKH